jgi:hypothetical protein
MSFENFKKDWTVIMNDESSLCKEGQKVEILGLPTGININCENKNFYGLGVYDKDTNTIKSVNGEYEIRMVLCIKFMPKTEGLIAGSWTAEDQGPWPGDG